MMQRRRFIQQCVSTGAILIATASPYLTFSRKARAASQTSNQFEDFKMVSKILLAKPIDLIKEDHAQGIWRALPVQEQNQMKRLAEVLQQGRDLRSLNPEDRRLSQKILNAWYTGVIEFSQERLFYESAEIYQSCYPERPVPGQCYGFFGYWQNKPQAKS